MSKIDETYQVIADILSFSATTNTLKLTLSESSMDWDALVVEGSKHLMLPAIYCRLKAKMLLDIPYLKSSKPI